MKRRKNTRERQRKIIKERKKDKHTNEYEKTTNGIKEK
jgi:hypothetical protein